MIKKLLDLLYKYEMLGMYADDNFVYDAVTIIMRFENTYDYIKDVNIVPTTKESFGNYAPVSKILQVSIDSRDDLDFLFDYMTQHNKTKSSTLNHNIAILSNILHETDHALMQKQCDYGEDNLFFRLSKLADGYNILLKGLVDEDFVFKAVKISDKMKHVYDKHHDYCPYETRAIMSTYHLLFDLFRELYKTDINKEHMNYLIYCYRTLYELDLIKRYKETRKGVTRSTSYDYCKKLRCLKNDFPEELKLYNKNKVESYENDSKNYSLNERLEYGLQLSSEELESVLGSDIYNGWKKRKLKLNVYMK